MLKLVCSDCGTTHFYCESQVVYEFDFVYVICYNCEGTIKIPCETIILEKPSTTIVLPVLQIGEIVKIDNENHVWHDEIAIIRAVKPKHYRLEIHGQLIWIPESWVTPHELNDAD